MTTLAKARRDFLVASEAAVLADARNAQVRKEHAHNAGADIDALVRRASDAARAAWRRYDKQHRALARAVVQHAGLPAWTARL